MSATERLHRLLTERGIEHESVGGITTWVHSDCYVAEYDELLDGSDTRLIVFRATPEQAVDATLGPKITEDTSDGWHSFKDLYHHRALLFSVIVHTYRDMCWKSKRHHDGKELDWNFIVGIDTPWGQASYHYGMEYWDLFDCKEVEQAPYYDGYTADESVARIARLVELDTTCHDLGVFSSWGMLTCSNCESLIALNAIHIAGKIIGGTPLHYCHNCGRRIVE